MLKLKFGIGFAVLDGEVSFGVPVYFRDFVILLVFSLYALLK